MEINSQSWGEFKRESFGFVTKLELFETSTEIVQRFGGEDILLSQTNNLFFFYDICWLYLAVSANDLRRVVATTSIFSSFFMLFSITYLSILLAMFIGVHFSLHFWLLLTFNKMLSIPGVSVIIMPEEVQMLSTLQVMFDLSLFFGVVISDSTRGTFSDWLIVNSCITDEGTLFPLTAVIISLVLFKAFLSLNFFHFFFSVFALSYSEDQNSNIYNNLCNNSYNNSLSLSISISIYLSIYLSYLSIYLFVFRFHIESWPEWDSNPQPCVYHAHAQTTELSGRTMRCAWWSTESSDHEAQVIARWLQWASLNHIRT